jgi:hypothetical protein
VVRAIEVQYWVAQCPGEPAWPITQPVRLLTKVTEDGWKLTGTGAGFRTACAELAVTEDAPVV